MIMNIGKATRVSVVLHLTLSVLNNCVNVTSATSSNVVNSSSGIKHYVQNTQKATDDRLSNDSIVYTTDFSMEQSNDTEHTSLFSEILDNNATNANLNLNTTNPDEGREIQSSTIQPVNLNHEARDKLFALKDMDTQQKDPTVAPENKTTPQLQVSITQETTTSELSSEIPDDAILSTVSVYGTAIAVDTDTFQADMDKQNISNYATKQKANTSANETKDNLKNESEKNQKIKEEKYPKNKTEHDFKPDSFKDDAFDSTYLPTVAENRSQDTISNETKYEDDQNKVNKGANVRPGQKDETNHDEKGPSTISDSDNESSGKYETNHKYDTTTASLSPATSLPAVMSLHRNTNKSAKFMSMGNTSVALSAAKIALTTMATSKKSTFAMPTTHSKITEAASATSMASKIASKLTSTIQYLFGSTSATTNSPSLEDTMLETAAKPSEEKTNEIKTSTEKPAKAKVAEKMEKAKEKKDNADSKKKKKDVKLETVSIQPLRSSVGKAPTAETASKKNSKTDDNIKSKPKASSSNDNNANDRGPSGPQGPPGPKGERGPPGNCSCGSSQSLDPPMRMQAAISAVLTKHFGPAKDVIVPFDLELIDSADNYDNASGVFFCSIPGTYVISVYLMSHPGSKVNARVFVNSRPVAALWADDSKNGGFYPSSSIQTISRLAFGDQVYVMLVDGGYGESWVHANYNVFTVFLLYEEFFSK